MSEARKNISPPKGEHVWVRYCKDEVPIFLLTSKENSRDFYFLYEIVAGSLKKLGKARSPLELETKYDVHKRLVTKGWVVV